MIATLPLHSPYEALTTRQRLFVDKYLVLRNATRAAKEAGYSLKTARQMGAENLSKPYIKEAIEEKLKAVEPDYRLTPERLRRETASFVTDTTLRPDTRLKAIELAGKMTPGTFEATAPPTQINFFTILAKLNAMTPAQLDAIQRYTPSTVGHIMPASDVGRTLSPSDVEALSHAQAHTSPGPIIDITPTPCTASSTSGHAPDALDDTQPAAEARTPHATPLGVVKNTHQNVEQNQSMSHVQQEGGGI